MSALKLLFGPLLHVLGIERRLTLGVRYPSAACERLVIWTQTSGKDGLGLSFVDVILKRHSFVVALYSGVILVEFRAQSFVLGP